MRKIALMILVVLLMAVPTLGSVQAQGGDPAVITGEYLKSQQLENGSWENDLNATAQAIISLSALGEDTSAALAWMESEVVALISAEEPPSVDTAATILIAVAETGGDVTTFAEGQLLATFTETLMQSRGEDITELCFGLVALPALGQEFPSTAIMGLGMLQNEDGGYGTPEEQPTGETDATEEPAGDVVSSSTVEETAICAQVLAAAGETDALAKALEYLKANQKEDGGWAFSFADTGTADPFATAIVIQTLLAAGEDLANWGNPENTLFGFINFETGEVTFGDGSIPVANIMSTALAVQVFRGVVWADLGAGLPTSDGGETSDGGDTAAAEEGPALDPNWAVVAGGFGMAELDTADDFLVTVVDPFNGDELFGVQIINWTAEYTYTPFLIEQFMTADVLLWLADHEPDFWTNLSDVAIGLLPADVLAQLPEDVQARAGN
ncbi:MAG: hypothetical protein DPW16_12145 [Chloroflexi bacterium]|nr:hypothetical protein [Chloroflexota bacterium]